MMMAAAMNTEQISGFDKAVYFQTKQGNRAAIHTAVVGIHISEIYGYRHDCHRNGKTEDSSQDKGLYLLAFLHRRSSRAVFSGHSLPQIPKFRNVAQCSLQMFSCFRRETHFGGRNGRISDGTDKTKDRFCPCPLLCPQDNLPGSRAPAPMV